MRSSNGRNSSGNNGGSRGGNSGGRGSSGGRGNYRGAGNSRDDRQGPKQGSNQGGKPADRRDDRRDDRPSRPSKPRPEERRYDVGGSDAVFGAGARKGRGAAARGGAKGGPRTSQGTGARGSRRGAPRRPASSTPGRRSATASAYAGKPKVSLPKTFPGAEQEGERLQKVLARAGYGSRRACEELVDEARVEVNGEIVVEQGMRVDPEKDEIKVDGLTVATQSYQFFSLNKPAGVVSTMEDTEGRQCLGDYVTNRETRLFHVGRLDTETEGVILLTNHGELAHRLTHPKYGVKKVYLAHIVGPIPRDLGKQLKDGIQLEDGYARADHFRVVEQTGKNYLVEVTLHEGRKHIVRRMLAEAGFPVDKLVRVAFGPITLGDQKSGWLRRLSNTEVGMLMKEVDL